MERAAIDLQKPHQDDSPALLLVDNERGRPQHRSKAHRVPQPPEPLGLPGPQGQDLILVVEGVEDAVLVIQDLLLVDEFPSAADPAVGALELANRSLRLGLVVRLARQKSTDEGIVSRSKKVAQNSISRKAHRLKNVKLIEKSDHGKGPRGSKA